MPFFSGTTVMTKQQIDTYIKKNKEKINLSIIPALFIEKTSSE